MRRHDWARTPFGPPASWPAEERERVEALQLLTAPRESRVVEAESGLIAATIAWPEAAFEHIGLLVNWPPDTAEVPFI